MTLPGAALVPATMRDLLQYSRYAGRKIMELVEKQITPSKILTPAAFKNAIIVHCCHRRLDQRHHPSARLSQESSAMTCRSSCSTRSTIRSRIWATSIRPAPI